MGWFKRHRGADINVLKRTMYWTALESMIETDQETYTRLVQYIYEQVTDSLIAELERTKGNLPRADDNVHGYLYDRIATLKHFKELAYGRSTTETEKS